MSGKRKGTSCGSNVRDNNTLCGVHRKLKGVRGETKGKPKVMKDEIKKAYKDPEYPLQPIESAPPSKPFFNKISNMKKNKI